MAGNLLYFSTDFIDPDRLLCCFQRYNRLQDLQKLLMTFKSIASHVIDDLDQDLVPIDPSLQQLKDLAQITKDMDRSKILQNILIAAMNLRQIISQTDNGFTGS